MFRHHMSQFGSCASEVHKTLCYFFAGINIFLAIDFLADCSDDLIDDLNDDDSDERLDDLSLESHMKTTMLQTLIGPAIANIILAVLLIIGVYKRRPAFIRLFKLFIIAQIFVLLIACVFSYYVAMKREGSNVILLLVLIVSIALFGTEAWIVGDYHKLLLEELRVESLEESRVI
ncbi:uncharacterized protein LOC129724368 isoform X1 [Wyeomyia smithii]|uniref:uncharacterized protein LOC129724368 isoform X1 n=1 Tax=Wyeomyia smithii TaxID=174621 RepID=UPI002467E65A|nr:uncharacterized protein LOC129724368 isoform X1 [Wyeomyia smithii]XP_055535198.1 uncharacterized protein LOC129724368 isoform X1 [Wyeomyia smithii]XP_055535200.1 uncharacterized protein LOC129724368 isoform X1 [Wyeomyia smithii]